MPFGIGGSGSSNKSFVAPFQQPFLEQLFSAGSQLIPGAQEQIQQSLPGLQEQVVDPTLSGFQDAVSGQGGNPFLQQLLGDTQTNLNQNFTENILPSLRRGSTGRAGFGASSGARGEIAEGIAARGLLQAQGQAENALNFNAFNTQQQSQANAINNAGNVFNLGLSPALANFAPLQAQQGIVGSPIILGKGKSQGFNFSRG